MYSLHRVGGDCASFDSRLFLAIPLNRYFHLDVHDQEDFITNYKYTHITIKINYLTVTV